MIKSSSLTIRMNDFSKMLLDNVSSDLSLSNSKVANLAIDVFRRSLIDMVIDLETLELSWEFHADVDDLDINHDECKFSEIVKLYKFGRLYNKKTNSFCELEDILYLQIYAYKAFS